MRSFSFQKCLLPLTALICLVQNATAEARFEFLDGGPLDGSGLGGTMTVTDYATFIGTDFVDVTLTTIDIVGSNGTRASDGAGHTLNSQGAAQGAGNSNALGIDSTNISNSGNDERDFNPSEQWTISFNTDVELNEIDFAGWSSTSVMTISFSDGTPTSVPLPAAEGLTYNDGDGFGWTTTELEFLDNDGALVIFENGQSVIFGNNGNRAIIIQDEGVIADTISWTNFRNGTLNFINAGDLTANNITNYDHGTIEISNTTVVNGLISNLRNGELEIADGGNLTFERLALAGGSLFELYEGGTYDNLDGIIHLGEGGAEISKAIPLVLGAIENEIHDNEIEIDGLGSLTLTAGLGTLTSGPVNLTAEGGELILTGSELMNLGSIIDLQSDLILAGAPVQLHGSTLFGNASLIVRESSQLDPRLNEGPVNIEIPLSIEADQTLSLNIANANNAVAFNNAISGDGNLTKQGNGTLTLTNASGHQGDTNVEGGNLVMTSATLSDSGNLSFFGNGSLHLNHGQGDTVNSLSIDGISLAPGLYGSSTVLGANIPSQNILPAHLTGSGWLIVLNLNDYNNWSGSSGFQLTGGPTDDDDGDGLSNQDEYAFGLDPTSASSSNPFAQALNASGTFSYTRRNPDISPTGLSYSYEYSTSLNNDWVPLPANTLEIADNANPTQTVTVTLPPELIGTPKLFVRVIAQ